MLDVASSSTSTGGSNASARANDSSCFWPTDSVAPAFDDGGLRSPPSASTNDSAWTAASARADLVVADPARCPRRMLAAIVPENRCTSCSTSPNDAPQLVERPLADVDAVHGDPAAADVVEPQQQVDDRRLARAGGADDADALAGCDRERHVAQHVVLVVVREPDVFERDVHGRAVAVPRLVHRALIACALHRAGQLMAPLG